VEAEISSVHQIFWDPWLGGSRSQLEFSVCVRADLAIEVNFLVLGGYPFHDKSSF
jgi:hypothetical protein